MTDENSSEDRPAANPYESIVEQHFGVALRSLMRAVAADDPYGPLHKAATHMDRFLRDSSQFKVSLDYGKIFRNVIVEIRGNVEHARMRDYEAVNVAEKGLMFLIETSCVDSAAAGRTSRRLDTFKSWAESWLRRTK